MLRTPCAFKTQASAPPAGAATSSSGNGAESACSIVKERCWAGAMRLVSTSAARHARVRKATNMTVPLGMAASKLSLTTSLGKSYLSAYAGPRGAKIGRASCREGGEVGGGGGACRREELRS